MWIPLLLTLFTLLLGPTAHPTDSRVALASPGDAPPPRFVVTRSADDGIRIEVHLLALQREEFEIDGTWFQALTVPSGDIDGQVGEPGLPVFTRLVAVPAGSRVRVRVVSHERERMVGCRLLPVLPEGEPFTLSPDAYARPRALPEVSAGEPVVIAGLSVVPLTFAPVSYDPVREEATVTTHLEVEVSFEGGGQVRPTRVIPESFDELFRDLVLNYEGFIDRTNVVQGPGTYLLIYRDVSGVLSALQPLIDLRKRQGYHVLTASTTQTGTTTTSIKNYIQNVYNTATPPLEFVCIAGDVDGTYGIPTGSYSGGEGDHTYTTLDGGDYLSDVHIGRLSYSDLTNLQAIVTKVTTYETNPPLSDAGWFTRACLTGDPSSSGITCIYINQWVKSQLIRAGYTQVDTVFSSPWVSQMTSKINQGLSVFGYRGYLGMSGMNTSNISGLTNGNKLPFAVIPTCGTGDFQGETSRSEAFLRNPNGGAIGSVGTSTLSTHTRYNNCYYSGTWDGAINGTDHRLGYAHTRGKLNLYLNYKTDGDAAQRFMVWNNLMGDPATRMWTGYPTAMTVSYPPTIPVGVGSIPVTVTSGPLPVPNALVTVYKAGELQVSGYTDPMGRAVLPVSGYTAGTALVTVTKHNHFPHLGQVTFGSASGYAAYAGCTVDDDGTGGSSGNGNGILNPGETIELPVALRNWGSAALTGVSATLSTTDPFVTITDDTETYGTIGPGATVWSAEDFDFTLDPGTPDGHVVNLDLTATSGASSWVSLIQLSVQSAAYEANGFTWGGGGATPDPGESGTLSVKIRNIGSIAGVGTTGVLSTSSPWVSVTDPNGSYGTVGVGAMVENTADTFALEIAGDCPKGHVASFELVLTFNGGARDTASFTLTLGTTGATDPVGPDGYGYYAFDNTDTGYLYAPTYEWVEIDPTYGGSGVSVGLNDFGYEQDDTKVMNLPFVFRFYGQDYTQISICSNGWVAMGRTNLKPYTNTSLPSAGAPDGIICAWWDDLYQSGTNKVYYLNDTANHRYIIQWSRMKNLIDGSTSATQNFQMILLDPAYYQTSTGDGQILLQYHTVNNTDYRDGYATVGIQNQDHTDGLLYTYWNQYPPGAASIVAGRAIRILPIGSLALGTLEGDVTNASNGGTPLPNVTIRVLETNQTMISGGTGHYAGVMAEGTYTVRAEHPSFAPVTVPNVAIAEGQTTELDFALTDIQAPQISGTTQLQTTDDPAGPYVVETTISDFSSLGSALLRYQVDGGPVQTVGLTLINPGTGLYRGSIPGQPYSSEVAYWVEATDVASNTARDPSSGAYTFSVLMSVVIAYYDMETDQGWTVGDVGDNATSGIWVRVDPNGVWYNGIEVQPEDDATPDPGVMCYITGNDPPGSSQGVDDVDNGQTTLLSPWINLAGSSQVQLSYRRWYTNDTGSSPGLDYWVVQVTSDGTTWVDLERTTASDRSWALKQFMLDSYVPLTSTMRLRFIASDVAPGSIVEAGVDEVKLTGFSQASLPVSANCSGNELVLTWAPFPTASAYWIHGSDNDAYFAPTLANRVAVVGEGTTTWSTQTAIGDPAHNWTYLVRAMSPSGVELVRSNRVGEHDWNLQLAE